MERFLIALQFITRIPVTKELDYTEKKIAGSMVYYPLIGTLLGSILVLINGVGSLYLPELVTSSLLLIGLVVLTGGIHLDGFMDTCDGIFSGRNQEKMLEIMRDSRVGAFGVLGVVLLLLLKFSLLVELPAESNNFVLLYFPTVSRWAMVYSAFNYPYPREEGLGKVYAQQLTKLQFGLATAWTVLLGVVLFKLQGLVILLVSWLLIVLTAKVITAQIEGLTGDSYGAVNELLEVGVILAIFCGL